MANQHAAEFMAAFDEHIDLDGQEFLHERSEEGFDALIVEKPAIDPRLELGSDLRELALITGRRGKIPTDIKHGDVIQQLTGIWFAPDTPPQNWKVVKRDDNPSSIGIHYWVVKIADVDE